VPSRRVLIPFFFACVFARCLFPSLDGLSGSAAGPIAYVQQFADAAFPPATVTLQGAIGAGDTLVACSAFPQDFGSLQVSDTLGRAYVMLGSQDGVVRGRSVCFVSIGGPGGNDAITFRTTSSTLADGAAHVLEAYVFEYQNVKALDQKLVVAGALGADAGWDAGSIMATSPNELLFAWVESQGSGWLDPSFTSRTTYGSNNIGDRILDAAGAFPITGAADNNWTLIAATFKGF
jgi:hypothetical protein